jgi:hypothetical protein
MKDIYRILGVSEDDVDVNIRYCIIYVLHKGILDLSEAWVHQPVIERFSDYTHQNAVRLHRIAVYQDDGLVFDLELIDPDVAIQEIVDAISSALGELLPWPHALEGRDPWREVRIVTIGDPESVEKDLTAYLEAVRRSKADEDDELGQAERSG